METHEFVWIQGSVYVSKKPIKSYRTTRILNDLIQQNPWLHQCMRDCRETNIGKEHSKNHLFDKGFVLPNYRKVEEGVYFYAHIVYRERDFSYKAETKF